MSEPKPNQTDWNEMSDFERRSCATKKRFSLEPPLRSMALRAYPCSFCQGWHIASRYKHRHAHGENIT